MWFLSKKSLEKDFQVDLSTSARNLNAIDLIVAGLGAMIGCGVFTLTGIVAAQHAGPSVILSYAIAGFATIIVALLYSELSSAFPSSGSIYSCGCLAFGEFVGWMVFSVLAMEMMFSIVSAASALSAYFAALTENILGWKISSKYLAGPFEGGIVNLPAVIISLVFGFSTIAGAGHRPWINNVLVIIKALTIGLFIVLALPHFDSANLKAFAPFGFGRTLAGASILFFAFNGFSVIPTLADSCKNPSKDVVVGVLGSVLVTIAVYVLVASLAVGFCHYSNLGSADALFRVLSGKYQLGTRIMGFGVIIGMSAVFLIMFGALVRVLAFVAKDGLLPNFFKENPVTNKPIGGAIFCSLLCAILAGTMKYDIVAQASSIGSLGDYTIAVLLVMAFRSKYPDVKRSFKCPLIYLMGITGMAGTSYLLYKQLAESDRALGIVVGYWLLGLGAFYWIYAAFRGKYSSENGKSQGN